MELYIAKDFKILIDPQDQDLLQDGPWYNVRGHAYNAKHYLHRLIAIRAFGARAYPWQVDHINRLRNDNRRCNLRWVTPQQQSWNRKNNVAPFIKKHRGGYLPLVPIGHLVFALTKCDTLEEALELQQLGFEGAQVYFG
jgi:hypothetical protein